MITSFFGKNFLWHIAAVCLLLCGTTSCGTDATSANGQESAGFGVSGEDAGSGLAVDAFVFVATQAVEQQCEKGNTSACKIAFAVNPDFKNQMTQQEILNTLASMGQQLNNIESKLSIIEGLLGKLADQLKIAVSDLKLDSAQGVAAGYMRPVQAAYDHLQATDFSASGVDPVPFVKSAMTSSPSSNPWDVPGNLDNLHQLIVDPSSQGLFTKMDALLADKWKNSPPSYYDAINSYELMEQYFGYLLTQQAKGLMVTAACYNYLSIFPNAAISDQLLYKTFDEYLKNEYAPHLEQQVKVFLQHVESYIANVADVNKPGIDASNDDLHGWTSVVLRRADLMAAWARAGLKQPAAGTPLLLAVRVLGEPDRSMLLINKGTIMDEQTGKQYGIDKSGLIPGSNKIVADYRQWTARGPYIQFPVNLDLAKGTVERDGAIKGANSLVMSKYTLTGSDIQSPVQEGLRSLVLPDWVGHVETVVNLVGPDGNPPKAGDPALYYGHVTIVLKETAARQGVWSHVKASEVYAKTTSADNLRYTDLPQVAFPQSSKLYLHADPKRSSKKVFDPSGAVWTEYSIKGNAYFYTALEGKYLFEGWGDIPEKDTWRVSSLLSGKSSHDVTLSAEHGSKSLELYFTMGYGQQWVAAPLNTDNGNVKMSVASAAKWAPNTAVRVFIEPRIKCDWNTQRTREYGTCTFQGFNKFDLKSLVMQVKG